jgi:hypothetical protein
VSVQGVYCAKVHAEQFKKLEELSFRRRYLGYLLSIVVVIFTFDLERDNEDFRLDFMC